MARINVRNGNIKVSNTEPVAGQEFTVTVPANNREIFGGGAHGCKRDGLTRGHLADISLTVRHETLGVVEEETKEGVCVPLDQIGSSSVEVGFDVSVSQPGEITITASIDPQGNSPPDQASATAQVIDTGESDPVTGPGGGSGGISLPTLPGGGGVPGGDTAQGLNALGWVANNPAKAAVGAGVGLIVLRTATETATKELV